MAKTKEEDSTVPEETVQDFPMDIRKYLEKRDFPKAIQELFKAMLGGQTKTESEWDLVTKEILSHKA